MASWRGHFVANIAIQYNLNISPVITDMEKTTADARCFLKWYDEDISIWNSYVDYNIWPYIGLVQSPPAFLCHRKTSMV